MIPLVPAIIPKSAADLRTKLESVRFSPEVHVDVVDGDFVSAISWPYEPVGAPAAIKDYTDSFTLEVDLMVRQPLQAAEDWLKAGADMLVFHIETLTLSEFRTFVESVKISVGVSASNDTPLDSLYPYLETADYLQLMGIAEIGRQGQAFDERVLDRIESCRHRYPHKPITVDGSVNVKTIPRLKAAKVDRLIVGSAIVGQPDPGVAHYELAKALN